MFTLETILSGVVVTICGYSAWLEKRLHDMQKQIDDKISAEEAEHLIDIKHTATDIRLQDLKEDLKEIKQDLKDLKNKL